MKLLLIHIIFSIFTLQAIAQKPVVWLEVDPKEGIIGEVLTITIKSNVQGDVNIDLPSGFVHGYNVVNAMDQEIDYNTGKVITYYFLSQTGAMPKAGAFKFGPAFIKKGNKVYKSNTVNVTIKKESVTNSSSANFSAKQLSQPAFGVIEKSKATIYEGEPVILNAKVYSQFEASHMEDYQEYSMNGVLDKHVIGGSTTISVHEEKINRRTFYSFEYDKKVVFPIGTGKINIEPFKMTLRRGIESMSLTSNGASIEIKPLPSNVPSEFIGGVGQFSVSRSIQSTTLKQGDVFTMTVEVAGFGNIQNIMEPKLNLPKGFVVYGDPLIKEDFVFGNKGAEGKIIYEYNIQVTKYGKITLPETIISYFDPSKEKYITNSTDSDVLTISMNTKFKANSNDPSLLIESNDNKENFNLRRDEGNKNTTDFLVDSPAFWLGLSSPILLGFAFGIFWKRKEKQVIEGQKKQAIKTAQLEIQHLFKDAENALKNGNHKDYYNMIEKGIQRSMALFLKKDDSIVLSKVEIFTILEGRQIDPSKCDALRSLFSTCEQARYGFGISDEERDNLIISAKRVIHSIDRS